MGMCAASRGEKILTMTSCVLTSRTSSASVMSKLKRSYLQHTKGAQLSIQAKLSNAIFGAFW